MKKYIYIFLACAAVFSFAACVENVEINPDENGPVLLNVSMEQPVTKATIGESDGVFKFSENDAIKVYNGIDVYTGSTTSTSTEGTFTMDPGFENTGSGFAGFPASLVKTLSGSGVTFVLPSSYEYAEVGATTADAAKVPCPMMGTFTAGSPIKLMQAGAVVRIRVTNIKAGSLSFTFPTKVTGEVTLSSVPSGEDGGILADGLKGNTISVSGVPEVTSGNYIFITLPVPTATKPEKILVTNEPTNASRSKVASIAGNDTPLARAKGYRLSASLVETPYPTFTIDASGRKVILAPGNLMAKISVYHYVSTEPAGGYAEADEWKFGSAFEYVGDVENKGNYLFANAGEEGSANATALIGQWVDLFSWQGESAEIKAHGLSNYTALTNVKKWCGDDRNENLYSGCWNGLNITNGGGYAWRPMTKDEMEYLMKSREGSVIGEVTDGRHVRAIVAGVKGLLIFPDGIIWRTTAQGESANCGSEALNTAMTAIADVAGVPTNLNVDGSSPLWNDSYWTSYSASDFATMSQCGIVFLPAAGFHINGNFKFVGSEGRFWTSSSRYNVGEEEKCHVGYMRFDNAAVNPIASIMRMLGQSVRLVRDVAEPEGTGRGSSFKWDE